MSDIIGALKEVPEVHLSIIRFAWELAKEDGTIDAKKAAERNLDIEAAIDEAGAYAQETQKALACLKSLVK